MPKCAYFYCTNNAEWLVKWGDDDKGVVCSEHLHKYMKKIRTNFKGSSPKATLIGEVEKVIFT